MVLTWITRAVSPPTRGWTRARCAWRHLRTGFPAHAGMDLSWVSWHRFSTRFPRPRGDGPFAIFDRRTFAEVSPPTRGWTVIRRKVGKQLDGFPAHAGMDPEEARRSGPRRGFPRPRGDGPSRRSCKVRASLVSPPTRGWTLAVNATRTHRHGFPAHAGMDPLLPASARSLRRFPRPRGDGPPKMRVLYVVAMVSPPTRGWTRFGCVFCARHGGFPAHAGMDPSSAVCHRPTRRFPRPRGDGPQGPNYFGTDTEVSPPTRGWTREQNERAPTGLGFPAHAGMDLYQWRRGPRYRRFPRPRGDGPPLLLPTCTCIWVSPPTRGWTQAAGLGGHRGSGFPAHAGMDLVAGCRPRRPRRFPRPRGDGPTQPADVPTGHGVSPPTRGWTP